MNSPCAGSILSHQEGFSSHGLDLKVLVLDGLEVVEHYDSCSVGRRITFDSSRG
jgi:hypothetical protein